MVNKEIKKGIRKYLKTNESENTTFQNLWDAGKAILRGELIAIQAYLKKQEKTGKKNKKLRFHLKELEKEEQSPQSAEGRN